jgi:hypothetical protein
MACGDSTISRTPNVGLHITNRLLRNTPRLGRKLLGQKTYATSGPTGTILTTTRNSKGLFFRKSKGALTRKTKGVRRISSRFQPHHNVSVLQTNNGHISKWDQARKSELTRILMSKSIRYCYQDTSYADPDKGIHVQFNLTDSNITAPFPTHGDNTTTVSHPQPPVPSDHNDWPAIGFSTELGPKNRIIAVHFHEANATTRAIPDTKFNELHDRIISDTHFWN